MHACYSARAILTQPVDDDGVAFDVDGLEAAPIREDLEYGGVRVRTRATIAGARIPIQVDVGFGDAITPGPIEINYPALLDGPAPHLRTYPIETVVAEKFHALAARGITNSRLKDYYDLWLIAKTFDLDKAPLAAAVRQTFSRRETALPREKLTGLTEAYVDTWGDFHPLHVVAVITIRQVSIPIRYSTRPVCSATLARLFEDVHMKSMPDRDHLARVSVFENRPVQSERAAAAVVASPAVRGSLLAGGLVAGRPAAGGWGTVGLAVSLVLCLAISPARVFAIQAQSDMPRAGDSASQLEEVTVTARRRAEPLQDVPVAVSVITGAQAAAHNLNDLQDISSEIPTVDFRTGASNKDRDIFIRGIGTITTSPGVEPSVSTVVDGVVLARPGQATVELLDVDHVEVLRGPQGTLFGKNASAGVVNIVTQDPTADTHGYADGAYFGGGDEFRLKGGLSGELIHDKLLGSFSGVYSHYDGNVRNLYDGSTVNGYERYGGHSKLIFTASDDLTVTFNADYLHSKDSVPTGVPAAATQASYPTGVATLSAPFATALAGSGVASSYQNTHISDNLNSGVRDDNGGVSITVDDKLGAYTLTSITAYRRWLNVQDQDYDQLSAPAGGLPQVADHGYLSFDQISEEARIASPKGQFVDYVAGLYYLHAVDGEIYQRAVDTLAAGTIVPNTGVSSYGTHADNYSVFGEGNFNFTESLRGILGARLVRDELKYQFQRVASSATAVTGIQPSFASAGATDNYGYTDRVGLQYDVAPDVHSYATYSHGYTGPAYNVFFNMTASSTLALKPETSDSYEVGLKSRLLGGKLQANFAVYLTDFDNYQANFADVLNGALITRLINAGKVSTKGIEADVAYRPLDALTVTGAIARTDARVDHFNCPANAASSCNINGQPLPFAPDWKLNLDGNYVVPVTQALNLVLDTDYKWQSKVQYQLAETPDTVQAAYGVWDLSVGLSDDAKGWRVSALVKNVGDTHYSSYLAHGNLAGVVRWVPRDEDRYAGIDVHKSF